ncbi:MAG TPA: phosphate/phosphite/phosphonate ABC transporter substrate-binding protein [Gammaproteobacteria bacterium]|nr:phosphate/phosphite/phosphonate ABC transporter substrate-binding protein [Gammaproteobacteria bacterium]
MRGWVLILVLVLLGGCGGADGPVIDLSERIDDRELQVMAPQAEDDVIRVGFELRASPQEDARQYLPFLHYLAAATGQRFSLRFTPSGVSLDRELAQGRVQLALMGAVGYIKTHRDSGAIILARGLNREGRDKYRSFIVVTPESPLRQLDELRGHRLAFGSRDSTQGHLIPRIMLARIGLGLQDLAGYAYTGSHQACANAVLAGRFDACGMQDTMARDMAKAGLLRVLARSREYPSSGVVASAGLDAGLRERIREALLAFDPEADYMGDFYHWERTEMPRGFTRASDADYAELRRWVRRLGLLPAMEGRE